MFKNQGTGKFGKVMNAISIAMVVKASLWDRLTPEQKQRVIVAARGAAERAKAQGDVIVARVTAAKNSIGKK